MPGRRSGINHSQFMTACAYETTSAAGTSCRRGWPPVRAGQWLAGPEFASAGATAIEARQLFVGQGESSGIGSIVRLSYSPVAHPEIRFLWSSRMVACRR